MPAASSQEIFFGFSTICLGFDGKMRGVVPSAADSEIAPRSRTLPRPIASRGPSITIPA